MASCVCYPLGALIRCWFVSLKRFLQPRFARENTPYQTEVWCNYGPQSFKAWFKFTRGPVTNLHKGGVWWGYAIVVSRHYWGAHLPARLPSRFSPNGPDPLTEYCTSEARLRHSIDSLSSTRPLHTHAHHCPFYQHSHLYAFSFSRGCGKTTERGEAKNGGASETAIADRVCPFSDPSAFPIQSSSRVTPKGPPVPEQFSPLHPYLAKHNSCLMHITLYLSCGAGITPSIESVHPFGSHYPGMTG